MRCYVGVDGGGSKTTVAVAEETGRVLGRAVGGPSNYNATGIDVAAERVLGAIAAAVREVETSAGSSGGRVEIAGLCLALAGVARPEDDVAWRRVVRQWIEAPAAGLAWGARVEDVVITHDAMAALVGGTGKREGVVVIAGTGAIAFGVNAQGDERRASGWGYLLGDEGAGYWIGLAGLRAVCRADDGRGPTTALTARLLAEKGLRTPQQLVKPTYSEWKPVDIAALAPAVLELAAAGDEVAREIADRAAAELATTALAVLRSLHLTASPTEVVTAGSLWNAPLLRARFTALLHVEAPTASIIAPRAEPVMGALHLSQGFGDRASEASAQQGFGDAVPAGPAKPANPLGVSGSAASPTGSGQSPALALTEQPNPRSAHVDTLSALEIVSLMNAEDASIASTVRSALPSIALVVDQIVTRWQRGGHLYYFGAGTSGRLGVLDASECPPTFSSPPSLVQGFIAGGDTALRRSIEGAEDDPERGTQDVSNAAVNQNDIVVGIAASGTTPYVLGAVAEARRRGAFTACIACSPGSPLGAAVDQPIEVAVGPEVLTGSTRLKAGTAQKLILNMLTTASMIRSGKVYGNLMVDLTASNVKLRRRAQRIVATVTGLSEGAALPYLEATKFRAKPAILMALAGCTAEEADRRLTAAGGFLRTALQPAPR